MCTGSHAFIPAENTAKVRMVFQTPGGIANNVFYFQNGTGWDAESLLDLADAVDTAWQANITPVQANEVLYQKIEVQDVSIEDGATAEIFALAAGSGGSGILPGNVTLAISFRTGFAGRSRRGRLYHVGLTETGVVGDKLVTGVQAGMQAAYAGLFEDVATALPGTNHVVVSYCDDGAWRTDALVTPVTSYSVDDTIDSMRRRLLGRGS